MFPHNKELSEIFHNMAVIYRYKGDDRFRALAYDKASRAIASLPEDIQSYSKTDTLCDIPGIGTHSEEKIKEYFCTGKISKYEELKKEVPMDILDITELSGFGPQSVKKLHEQLHIETKEELIKALQSGEIAKLKGFGKKKVDGMLRGLKLHKTVEERMLLWDALEAAEPVLDKLRSLPEVKKAELAGSLRRMKETIGDIDLLVACDIKSRKKIVSLFTGNTMAKQVLAKGDTKASIIHKDSGRQIDLRIVNENEWGSALQYFTGSKEHNVHLRTIAKDKGYKISEYGIFAIKNNKWIAGREEEDIYDTLDFKIMPPEMREDKGEIELAAKGKIPGLVSLKDIKGDLHVHSNWSDGTRTIDELARYVIKSTSYDYLVISDHSKSARVAGGMDEKQVLKQLKEIEKVNKQLGKDFIKKGMEVDILNDGKLDMPDEILSQLDWVTASIHTGFKGDNTDRLVAACQNIYVSAIGHPSGRLIGSREPYPFDIKELIKVAKSTGTALEINSQPQRMDLNDEMARLARENGVKLVITTVAHDLNQFNFIKLGVAIARRAWCTPADILNTRPWRELRTHMIKKRVKY